MTTEAEGGERPPDTENPEARTDRGSGEAALPAVDTAQGEALAQVLASIRALVSAETAARLDGGSQAGPVLMLTPEMRAEREETPPRAGAVLAEGLDPGEAAPGSAPILDEEGLRRVISRLVREELQSELGERIGRNLRKLIRREIKQIQEEDREI